MGHIIAETLPYAEGVAISPMPIIVVILVLISARARSNGLAFLAGWTEGLAVVGVVVLPHRQPHRSGSGALRSVGRRQG